VYKVKIAATLLEVGRTAHSALKLPLNLRKIDEPARYVAKKNIGESATESRNNRFGTNVRRVRKRLRRRSIER